MCVEVKEPINPKKIKTVGHYMRFVSKALHEMDKFLEMKNFYITMANASIHKPEDAVDEMIEKKNIEAVVILHVHLNYIHLDSSGFYSKVKRSQFGDAEDLKTRIAEAVKDISVGILQNIIRNFEKNLNEGKPLEIKL